MNSSTEEASIRQNLREAVRSQVPGIMAELGISAAIDARSVAHHPEFSRRLGLLGLIGVDWPVSFGGRGGVLEDRFAVMEELLILGAPVAAHWIAERQVGPSILRFGTAEQQTTWLPPIARGESYFSVALSEPEAGSDLRSLRTVARQNADDTWVLTGRKTWCSHGHRNDFAVVLARTANTASERAGHNDLSVFVVELAPRSGLEVRPIPDATGGEHFAEILFDDLQVPRSALLGTPGKGWEQIGADLVLERSGPEMYLSSAVGFIQFASLVEEVEDPVMYARSEDILTDYVAGAFALQGLARELRSRISLSGGRRQSLASLIKILGTQSEVEFMDEVWPVVEKLRSHRQTGHHGLQDAWLRSKTYPIRAGANEVLATHAARNLLELA